MVLGVYGYKGGGASGADPLVQKRCVEFKRLFFERGGVLK